MSDLDSALFNNFWHKFAVLNIRTPIRSCTGISQLFLLPSLKQPSLLQKTESTIGAHSNLTSK